MLRKPEVDQFQGVPRGSNDDLASLSAPLKLAMHTKKSSRLTAAEGRGHTGRQRQSERSTGPRSAHSDSSRYWAKKRSQNSHSSSRSSATRTAYVGETSSYFYYGQVGVFFLLTDPSYAAAAAGSGASTPGVVGAAAGACPTP
eukprot:GHVT01062532.1.p1 GENE.GHVT01062532.1~~GHVT01062532.1.p1  ORF type:complete len:143 (-),score=31.22 GHVT01062532.1:74-502(-)